MFLQLNAMEDIDFTSARKQLSFNALITASRRCQTSPLKYEDSEAKKYLFMNSRKHLFFIFMFFLIKSFVYGQDTFYVSKDCYHELQLRCNNKAEEVKRMRINRKLVKRDIQMLSKVQSYLVSIDTSLVSEINKKGYTRINPYRKKNTDTIVRVTELQLNYFSLNIYTVFIKGELQGKMAVLKDGLTFYCSSDGPEAPRNYSIIDPLFFEKHLKKKLRVNYFYYCNEVYLNRSSIFL